MRLFADRCVVVVVAVFAIAYLILYGALRGVEEFARRFDDAWRE